MPLIALANHAPCNTELTKRILGIATQAFLELCKATGTHKRSSRNAARQNHHAAVLVECITEASINPGIPTGEIRNMVNTVAGFSLQDNSPVIQTIAATAGA